MRQYENTPGELTAPPIPAFQFQRTLKEMLAANEITPDEVRQLLRVMIRIRRFEQTIVDVRQGNYRDPSIKYRGATHLCLGQEATAAPIALVLNQDDFIASTHRGHGHSIAKGTDIRLMMAEMFGREPGICKGKGGSMHIADYHLHHLGANGVVGGGLPVAGGAALACQRAGAGRVVIGFVGDGAMNTGSFHESLNMASQLHVPVLYAVEDNGVGMTGPVNQVTNLGHDLAVRAWAYKIPGEVVDGMNVLACLDAYRRAVKILRDGGGPLLFIFRTFRYLGHSMSDDRRSYRTPEEEEEWSRHDAVQMFSREIEAAGTISGPEIEALHQEVQGEIDDAVQFAWTSPEPPLETLTEDVYTPSHAPRLDQMPVIESFHQAKADRTLTVRDAIIEALTQAMETDPTVVVFGEDVARYGGAFGATTGLADHFGSGRVWNAPISENAIVGFGLGAGLTGLLRPVVEIMYNDFLAQAEDQIQNQTAKCRYMYGGKAAARLVVRTTIGGGKGYSCQHGQELVSKYATIPGLRVCVPATPFDAKGLLLRAIFDDNPVLFFEHQLLYGSSQIGAHVPEEMYTVPFGQAHVIQEGDDVTVWAYSRVLQVAINAAKRLQRQGIACEIIDPRTIAPLDLDPVVQSVQKTGRLVCVSQGCDTGNIVHTVVSRVLQACPGTVFRTVTAPDGVMPMAENLEDAFIPNARRLCDTITQLVESSRA